MPITKRRLIKQCVVTIMLSGFIFLPIIVIAETDINNQILDLRRQIEELTKQSQRYQSNINQKRREASTLQREISIMANQISLLENNIAVTERQINAAKLEINKLEVQILSAERSIDKNKNSIANLLATLARRDRVGTLAAMLQSPRLSDIAAENERTAKVNSSLLTLLTDTKQERDILDAKRRELSAKKNNLEVLSDQQSEQKSALAESRTSKDRLLVSTRGQEAKYQELLNDIEAKEAAFFEQLRTLESQALVNSTTIVHITANNVPKRGSKIFKTPYPNGSYRTQGYGMTQYARRGAYGGAPHNGIDLVAGLGAGIHPIGDGVVAATGYNSGFGNWIAIRHDNDMVSVYSHMRTAATLSVGTKVTNSSIIGYEGKTGNTTGAHLHLSLYKDFFTYLKNGDLYFNYFNGTVNPADYL